MQRISSTKFRNLGQMAVGLTALLCACGKDPGVGSVVPFPTGADAATSDGDDGGTGPGDPGRFEGGTSVPPVVSADAGVATSCTNLQCRQRACTGGTSTSISGKIYDPAGNNPLYNVVVYVPNSAVQPLPAGATCSDCNSLYSGSPIAVAQTDAAGAFKIAMAPDGANVPLVVQIGKWRRQFTLPNVAPCVDNPQPDKMLRLPRNRGEGDLPNIAISTGEADTLECLLRRIGVDASEYVPGAPGAGKIHIFQGSPREDNVAPNTAPPAPQSGSALWHTKDSLMTYDILLLSCEGEETRNMNQQALHDYASAGGRVFASHFHYSWFNSGPYASENLATWLPGSNGIDDIRGDIVTTLADGRPFPKGQALAQWLQNVGALQNGQLPIEEARHNADVTAAHTASQPWILADQSSEAPGAAQYFSFNTPTNLQTGPDNQAMPCGRVVYSDLHVGAASGDDSDRPVPQSCANRPLSAQEAALEFMLFDLSSCVMQDDRPPVPPPIIVLQ